MELITIRLELVGMHWGDHVKVNSGCCCDIPGLVDLTWITELLKTTTSCTRSFEDESNVWNRDSECILNATVSRYLSAKKKQQKQQQTICITSNCCMCVNDLICSFSAPLWWQRALHTGHSTSGRLSMFHGNSKNAHTYTRFHQLLGSFKRVVNTLTYKKCAAPLCVNALCCSKKWALQYTEAFVSVFMHTKQQICFRQWKWIR